MPRTPPPMTPFDEQTSNTQLQFMKLLLPYLPVEYQKMLAFYIKFAELQNIFQYYANTRFSNSSHLNKRQTSNENNSNPLFDPLHILEDIRPYMDPKDCESVDSILSILNMMEMMKEMGEDFMPDLSSFGSMFQNNPTEES